MPNYEFFIVTMRSYVFFIIVMPNCVTVFRNYGSQRGRNYGVTASKFDDNETYGDRQSLIFPEKTTSYIPTTRPVVGSFVTVYSYK